MKTLIIAPLVLSLAACATAPGNTFVADLHGKDLGQYNIDLGECEQYAATRPTTGEAAASGAVAGAIFGAIVMAVLTDSSDYLARGAGAGAVGGAATSAGDASQTRKQIVGRCMEGRGYSVLAY